MWRNSNNHIDKRIESIILQDMKELFENTTTKDWLTTKEAAAFLGVPRYTLHKLKMLKRIRAYEPTYHMRRNMDLPSRAIVFRLEDLIKLKAEMEKPKLLD